MSKQLASMGLDAKEFGMGGPSTYDDPELEALNRQLMGGNKDVALDDDDALLAELDNEYGVDLKKEFIDRYQGMKRQHA